MADFDMDAYLRRRFNPGTDKIQAVMDAAKEKQQSLSQYAQQREANADSWVNQLGLIPESVQGALVNTAASVVSGVGRMTGQMAALPFTAQAVANEREVTAAEWEAFNRTVNGSATKADIELLNRRKDESTNAPGSTPLELIQDAQNLRQAARQTVDSVDFSKTVHQAKRQELHKALGKDFDPAWSQVKQGAEALGRGEDGQGWSDVASGVGKLAANAGSAVLDNPGAAVEYIAENLPQLAIGLAGKVGKVALGASNVGYGADLFNQGVEKYQKDNQGQMPPSEVRSDMGWAATKAAVAEQAGDMLGLALMKPGSKAAGDAVRTGFKQSLLNTGKATGEGFVSEGLTEGYQTYEEGQATLKNASAKDIYEGAVIGGVAGAGLSGGGRGLAELAQATPEHQAKKQEEIRGHLEAVKTGDVTSFLDESKPTYDPIKAMGVLFGNSQLAETSFEGKDANLTKANEIVSGLKDKRDLLQLQKEESTVEGVQASIDRWNAVLPNANPAQAEAIQAQISRLEGTLEQLSQGDAKAQAKRVKQLDQEIAQLDTQLKQAEDVRLGIENLTQPTQADLDSAIEAVEAPVDSTNPESLAQGQAAANRLIVLSMRMPEEMDPKRAESLANNPANGLNEEQRGYFRTLSAAKQAQNALKTGNAVHREVLFGTSGREDQGREGDVGILQYNARVNNALANGNKKEANYQLGLLGNFITSHTGKLEAITQALTQTKGKPLEIHMKKTVDGQWQETYRGQVLGRNHPDRLALKGNGGFWIAGDGAALQRSVTMELDALTKTQNALGQAFQLRFHESAGTAPVVQSTTTEAQSTTESVVKSPVNSVDSQEIVSTKSTVETAPSLNHSNDERTVDTVAGSTEEAPVIEVKERKRRPISKRPDLIGAIMRVTGEDGINLSMAQTVTGDKASKTKLRHIFTQQGWEDLDELATLLAKEEGYTDLLDATDSDRGDGKKLEDLIRRAASGEKIYTPEESIEREAKARHKAEVKETNQQAREAGVKGVRGRRTIAHVLKDIERVQAEQAKLEKINERLGMAGFFDELSPLMMEALLAAESEAELDALIQETLAGLEEETHGNIESTEVEVQGTQEETTEAARSAPEGRDGERQGNGEAQKGTDGTGIDGESQGEVAAVVTPGVLQVFQKKVDTAGKKFAEIYQGINLVAQQLVQRLGKETDKTPRPLVAFKDFLSAWQKGEVSPETYLGTTPNESQEALLNDFKAKALAWFPKIAANLIEGNPDFAFKDPIQFLEEKLGQGMDLEENVKTAIAQAAYSYIIENANNPALSTREQVKEMYGVKEYEDISNEMYSALHAAGSMEKVVINSIGQRVVQALGFKANSEATQDFLPRLTLSLGAHAMKVLLDEGLLTRTPIQGQIIKEGLPYRLAKDTDAKAIHNFIGFTRNEQRKLNPKAAEIATLAKGTQGILTKLFGAEEELKRPSWAPVKFNQRTTKNTDQKVPAKLARIIAKANATPSYIRQDMWGLVNALGDQAVLAIAGFEETTGAKLHKFKKESIEAKNEALVRELDRAMEYFGEVETQSPEGLNQALYFEHSVWKQQRVGIATNMVNPQTSKLHRWMLFRKEWETTITSTDQAMMDSFRLRVLEGLGVKTDKQANEKSLPVFAQYFEEATEDPKLLALRAAVTALRETVIQGQEMTSERRQAIVEGVAKGGENMHSLDALVAMAHYEEAKSKGEDFTFTTHLMGEVDGVTNGPMLSHLLLGAAKSAEALFGLLNRGGFYRAQDGATNYNVWRGQLGHLDLYETTINGVIGRLQKMSWMNPELDPVLAAMYAITGPLHDNIDVLKAGRNIIKTPLTAMVFGSALDGAIDSMFNNFVDQIYDGFEKVADKSAKEQKDYLLRVQRLIQFSDKTQGMKAMPMEYYLNEFEFNKAQLTALKKTFKATLGNAVQQTMETNFGAFIETRKQFNNVAQATFGLFDAAYQGIREAYIQELIEAGEMAFFTNKAGIKVPRHDLTQAQQKVLMDRVKVVNPVLHTLMSKESNDLEAGLHISKSSREFSQEEAYRSQVKFGTPLPGGTQSLISAAYQHILTAPGVAMLPMSVHSFDSAISHTALEGTESLNIHDAHGSGVQHFTRTAQRLNKATWDSLLKYSPATEMRDAWVRTLMGMAQLIQSGEANEAVIQNVQALVGSLAYKAKMKPHQVLALMTSDMYATAYNADKVKLEAMSQMVAVDQYALEGGQYDVTEADRKAAADQLASLDGVIPQAVMGAIGQINQAITKAKAPKKAPKVSDIEEDGFQGQQTSRWGKIGQSGVPADLDLVRLFQKQGTVSVAQLVQVLSGKLNGRDQYLLKLVQKTVNPKLTVQYVAPETDPDTVLEKPKMPSHAWYVSKDGQEAIYVLGSEHRESGVTAEVLLHELIHGALAGVVEQELANKAANPDYTSAALDLINELDNLRTESSTYVKDNQLTQYLPALENVHEFLAWGMTNQGFQKDVLNQITLESKTKGNPLITGMKRFIEILTGLFFKKPNEQVNNGLSVLISNVSGLFYQAGQSKTAADINLSMAAVLRDYSTLDIFDALAQQSLAPTFETHLKSLLGDMVEKLHGPYGSLKEARMAQQSMDAAQVWGEARQAGETPMATAALLAGFPITEQEAFVLDQVAAVVQTVLETKDNRTSLAYDELNKLYKEVQGSLQPADFNTGDPVQDQALYDFVLANRVNFVAMGLAHQGFNKVLDKATSRATQNNAPQSFVARLQGWFQKVMETFSGWMTHTYGGQAANEKLSALVDKLVHIETKRRGLLERDAMNVIERAEDSFKGISESFRKKVDAFGKSKVFQGPKNGFVNVAGAAISTIASNRVSYLMDGMKRLASEMDQNRMSLAAGLIDEMEGANALKKALYILHRATKNMERQRKELITHTANVVTESFAKAPTKEESEALSAVFLRTDLQSLLDDYGIAGIQKFLNTPSALAQEIDTLEQSLAQFGAYRHYYRNQAMDLAYALVEDRAGNTHLMRNARAIATLASTGMKPSLTQQQLQDAEALIDKLTSLYALQFSRQEDKVLARQILNQEAGRGDANGVSMMLMLHKELLKQSRDKLFQGQEMLMAKGYTPEIYNPHREVVVALDSKQAEMEALGYVRQGPVDYDHADPDKQPRGIYLLKDGGLRPYVSGATILTGKRAKGSRAKNKEVADLEEWKVNQGDLQTMAQAKKAAIGNLFKPRPKDYDPSKTKATYAVPILNPQGEVVGQRYLMNRKTKELLLEPDRRAERLLGAFAGASFDKEQAPAQNQKVIQAVKDQYDLDYSRNPREYVRIGPTSTVKEHLDYWRMLPHEAQQEIIRLWGTNVDGVPNGMMIRKDMLDKVLGYRKASLSVVFDKDYEFSKFYLDKMFHDLLKFIFKEKAGMRVRQGEDIVQEIVREAKDIIVVKSVSVLRDNIISNVSALWWQGVPLKDIAYHHKVALRGLINYEKHHTELSKLRISLQANPNQTNAAEMTKRIAELEEEIAHNPVTELIDAGLMPTIVEDIAAEDDPYSYKSRFVRTTEKYTNKLNPMVRSAAKMVYMAKDTKMYQALHYGTQASDFIARYTLYQHLINNKKKPMNKEDALLKASETFVNYDIPSHRTVQWLNDRGFLRFTKYYLRIQKVLMNLYQERPGRALAMLLFSQLFDQVPVLMDSSMILHPSTHVGAGPLMFFDAADELATVKIGEGVLR